MAMYYHASARGWVGELSSEGKIEASLKIIGSREEYTLSKPLKMY